MVTCSACGSELTRCKVLFVSAEVGWSVWHWQFEPFAPQGKAIGRPLYWRCDRCDEPRSIPSGPLDDWTGGKTDPRRVGVTRIDAR